MWFKYILPLNSLKKKATAADKIAYIYKSAFTFKPSMFILEIIPNVVKCSKAVFSKWRKSLCYHGILTIGDR